MQNIFQPFKTAWGRLSGGGSQETNDQIDTSTSHDTTTHPKRSLRSGDLHARETHAQYTKGTGKRGREEGDQVVESLRKKMRQSRDDRASHLVENYDTPPEARRISVPQPAEEAVLSSSRTSRMPGRIGRGPHTPRNTLHEERYTSQMGNELSKNKARGPNTVIGRLPNPTLETFRSRGDNVRTPARFQPDGFRDDHELHSKKQKLSNGIANPTYSSEHIDLTEGDSQQACFGDVVGRATSGKKMAAVVIAASPPLEGTVARRLDRYTRTLPEKKKRKSMDSQGSSQNSNRATPNGMSNSQQGNRRTFNPVPMDIARNDDGAEEVEDVSKSTGAKPESARSVAGLTNGGRARQDSTKRSDSEEQIDAVSSIMNAEMLRKADSKLASTMQPPKQQEAARTGRGSLHQSDSMLVPELSILPQDKEDPYLRYQFVRDSPDEKRQSKLRAPQKMQASSDRPPRASLGSEDELAGAKTVASNASRSVSPQKSLTTSLSHVGGLQGSTSQREPSPSNIRPANFYSSKQSTSKKQSQKKREKKTDEEPNQVRIPVKSVLCRSCFSLEGKIVLAWDDESRGFFVELDGELQKIPNRDQLVCISGSEVKQWYAGEESTMLLVHLKTTRSSNSNGNIILGFADQEGLSKCYEGLSLASGGDMKSMSVPEARMAAIVEKVGAGIKEDYEKESRPKSIVHQDADLAGMQHRKNRREIRQISDPDEIVYEIDDPPSRLSRRTRMQSEASSAGGITGTKSKFFTWQSDQPRRKSSRQSQTIKEKSASPPPPVRWTRENKLERWAHSVVYPPEGTARRVTVDFQDLERLDEGEFLNDNIIGFSLRRIEESMGPEHKETVLFFNSFFYTALTTKGGKKAFNYDAVKRWTKGKDLFSFPYVVVPININLHWFVTIICNLPNLSRKVADQEGDPSEDDDMLLNGLEGDIQELRRSSNSVAFDDDTATRVTRKSLRKLSLSDDDDDDERRDIDQKKQEIAREKRHEPSSSRPSTAGSKKSKKKAPPRQRTFDPDAPSIITLDSFGSPHSIEIRTLKDYLNAEAQGKRGMEVLKDDLQGMTAKGIPEQTNFCDCGVYVVGYIEEFAKDPRKFVTKVLRRELDKEADFANFNPSTKRAEIRDELLKLHREQDAERKSKKVAKKSTAGTSEAAQIGDLPVATKTQADNEITAAQAPDSTAFVPLPPTLVNPPKTARFTQHEVQNQLANSANGDAANEDMELAVPRALGDTNPRLYGVGDAISPSSNTLIARDDEEAAMDEINHANSSFDQSRQEAVADDPESDLLSSAQAYLDSEHDAAQPTRSTDLRESGQNQVARNTDRNATSIRHRHATGEREVIDLSDENEPAVEIQDSQETQRLSVRNKTARSGSSAVYVMRRC